MKGGFVWLNVQGFWLRKLLSMNVIRFFSFDEDDLGMKGEVAFGMDSCRFLVELFLFGDEKNIYVLLIENEWLEGMILRVLREVFSGYMEVFWLCNFEFLVSVR